MKSTASRLTLLICFGLLASAASAADDYETRVYKSKGAQPTTLPYRLLKPAKIEDGKKYPLVIFFHGAGERGTDNQAQLRNNATLFAEKEVREKYPCFEIVPQCPGDAQWVAMQWGADSGVQPKEPTPQLAAALEVITAIEKEFPIDTKRVYVTGLSMGGFATWDIIARHPELFAAAAPVCGGGDEATAPTIAKTPIWAFHGAIDDVVKTKRTRNMIEAIKKAGGEPKYTEYPGVGHFAWGKAYTEPDFLPWLFAQHRK